MTKHIVFLFLLLLFQQAVFSTPVDLLSPDSSIKVSVDLTDKIYYSVRYNGDIILENSSLRKPSDTSGAQMCLGFSVGISS